MQWSLTKLIVDDDGSLKPSGIIKDWNFNEGYLVWIEHNILSEFIVISQTAS